MAGDDSSAAVFVVDDDASIRDAVKSLLKSVGLHAEVFGSTEEFLNVTRPAVSSCLVLDIRLPGMSGLEFQEELAKAGRRIPIIFVTAHGDIPMTSRAIKAGAIEFLTKPFQKHELLAAIHQALDRDRAARGRGPYFRAAGALRKPYSPGARSNGSRGYGASEQRDGCET
jgi:FixJ family two-component response regulator